ncbi:MAG TPA: ABC transporter ATP-binding protein, partial [Terriglobales bacterium]|nr:ABC transporter ATP-binding protein [Terriglobales bacterium]
MTSLAVTTPQSTQQAVTAAVELRNVSKHFDGVIALRGVSLAFDRGQLSLLLGENGAGKSTLLRLIAGLATATEGSIALFGSTERDKWKCRLGFMPHASLLYDELTGLENLQYFAALYGIRDREFCQRAIAGVGLDPGLQRRVGQYSQGMRQRLSLARAVVHDPDLLLLDEPFSNVDVASAREIAAHLARMRDAGKSVLVVTHQPQVLDGVADEAVFLEAGRVIDRRCWNLEALRAFEEASLGSRVKEV